MGRHKTQFGLCSTPGCQRVKLTKGMCMACYQRSRKGECKVTKNRHVPLAHTIWALPSGREVARCRYCDQAFQLQPKPLP